MVTAKIRMRRAAFTMWRGGPITAKFRGPDSFKPTAIYDPIDPSRVVGVDTEQLRLTATGASRTVLVPVAFADGSKALRCPEGGNGGFEVLFEELHARFGTRIRASQFARRKQKKPIHGRPNRERHGRRTKIPPILLCFYNLGFDLDCLARGHRALLRSVAVGTDTYHVNVTPRWGLEIVHLHRGNSASFEFFIHDRKRGTVVRALGIDLQAYWKEGLGPAGKALGLGGKDDNAPQNFDRLLSDFTPKQWAAFESYAMRDAALTRDVYLRTATLVAGDPAAPVWAGYYAGIAPADRKPGMSAGIVRRGGVIPPSVPGATARYAFGLAWTLHPNLDSWKRYPVWADQFGADSYFGGRSFCAQPGIRTGMVSLDLKSAYALVVASLPDPVTVACEYVKPGPFDVDRFVGFYGSLVVDGEGLDDVHPAFRIHDPIHDRLRYVFGRFTKRTVTIPELVIGVLSGVLRVDRIHRGVVLRGSPDKSFLRASSVANFAIKEDKSNHPSMRALSKHMLTDLYGKSVEVRDSNQYVAVDLPMPDYTNRAPIADALAKLHAALGPDPDELPGLYWGLRNGAHRHDKWIGETDPEARAKRVYRQMMATFTGTDEARMEFACHAYVRALEKAGEPYTPGTGISVRKYVQRESVYTCGHYFMPLYGAQITGLTSAKLGLMARCLGALQGDTDSVHVECPTGNPDDLPGWDRYFEIMTRAGYPSPRRVGSKIVGGLPGMEPCGLWEVETTPSLESILVRPKLYSHKYRCAAGRCPSKNDADKHQGGGGIHYKQAQHGFTRFTTPEAEAMRGRDRIPLDQRLRRIGELAAAGLHEAARCVLYNKPYSYETRKAPRKLKEAIITGAEVAEFVSKTIEVNRLADPNTWTDAAGVVHWHPLDYQAPAVAAPPARQKRSA